MLTVLTWLWSQPGSRVQFTGHHVAIWADMVRRHLTIPHRLACVTDMPDGIPSHVDIIAPPRDFEDVRISTWGEARPQCLRRIAMFAPNAAETFGGRFACMDLDCVVADSLDPILSSEDEFRICAGTAVGRPYNGSMLLLTAGARPQAYTKFTPKAAEEAGKKFIGSDQAWLAHILGPNERTWKEDDGVFWFGGLRAHEHQTRRIMFFPGAHKPWHSAQLGTDEWVSEHYRREPAGRCLIVGHEGDVWGDVGRALGKGKFDAVIASAEVAEHWTGPLLAVAESNDEAARIATMHGLNDIELCGEAA